QAALMSQSDLQRRFFFCWTLVRLTRKSRRADVTTFGCQRARSRTCRPHGPEGMMGGIEISFALYPKQIPHTQRGFFQCDRPVWLRHHQLQIGMTRSVLTATAIPGNTAPALP